MTSSNPSASPACRPLIFISLGSDGRQGPGRNRLHIIYNSAMSRRALTQCVCAVHGHTSHRCSACCLFVAFFVRLFAYSSLLAPCQYSHRRTHVVKERCLHDSLLTRTPRREPSPPPASA